MGVFSARSKKLGFYGILSVVFLMTFAACDQNRNTGIKVGSLQSDGNAVLSTGTLGSYNFSFSVQNIVLAPLAYTANAGYGQSATTSLRIDLILNGAPFQAITTPTVYNFSSAFLGMYTGSGMLAVTSNIFLESKCTTTTCETVFINIAIIQGSEFRQIGIKKSMTLNKITALTEVTGNYTGYNSFRSTDQIVKDLSNNSSI